MRKRKTVKVTAVLLMLSFVLAACGTAAEPTATPTPEPTPAQATPSPTPEATPEPTPEPVVVPDLGGRVIRFGGHGGGFSSHGPAYAERGGGFQTPDPEGAAYFRHSLIVANRERVEQMFNITFEHVFIPGGEIIETLSTSAMAGEAYVDLMYMGAANTLIAARRGYILPVDTLQGDRPVNPLSWAGNQTHAFPGLEHEGHIWGLRRPIPVYNVQGIIINRDIITAHGAPCPIDLWERGEWTWDAFRQIAEMTTTGEYYGVSGVLGQMMMNMVIANDEYLVNPNTMEMALNTPGAMAAMEFVQEILDNGWYMVADPEHENPVGGHAANWDSWQLGRSAMTVGVWPSSMPREPQPLNVDWIPFPIGPNNRSGALIHDNGRNVEVVVAGAEDPEILLWILEELFAWPGDYYYIEHEADQDWARAFLPTEATVQRAYVTGRDNIRMDLGGISGTVGAGFFNNLIVDLWEGNMTIAQYLEYHRADRNHAISTWFGLE